MGVFLSSVGIDELVVFPGPVLTTFDLDPRRVMVVAVSSFGSGAVLPRPLLVLSDNTRNLVFSGILHFRWWFFDRSFNNGD